MFLPLILLCMGSVLLVYMQHVPVGIRVVVGGELLGAGTVGLALSAPYWWTVLQMKPLVNSSVALLSPGLVTWENTVQIRHLFFGSLMHESQAFSTTEFLGAPFVAAALLGWWWGRRQPAIFSAGLIYIVLLAMMTTLGQWFWRLYPFSLLQFPWRLAVFAPLLQIMCLLGFVYTPQSPLIPTIKQFGVIVGGCILFGWSLAGHFGFKSAVIPGTTLKFNQKALACFENFSQIIKPGLPLSTIDAGEWMPLTAAGIAKIPARGESLAGCHKIRQSLTEIVVKMGVPDILSPVPRPLFEAQQKSWTAHKNPAHTDFRLDYQLSGSVPTLLTINQLYLPGWKIMSNAQVLSRQEIERNLLPDGRMQLRLPPGTWHIQAWYDGPPGWQLRNWLIAALCCIAAMYWSYRWYAAGRSHVL